MIRYLAAAFATTLAAAGAPDALAQPYPAKPIKMVNGFAPGGNVDLVGRIMAARLAEGLGQQVIIENRPGAGTMIANDFVAKSAPDGYTLILISGAFPTLAATQRKLPYDPVNDFAWISNFISYALVGVVRADSPIKTVDDLVAAAKRDPTGVTYGSPGVRSLIHLAGELFSSLAGVEMLHVPFKGSGDAMTDVLAGRITMIFETMTLASASIQAGKVRPIAVSSLDRQASLPDVPTFNDRVSGYEVSSFIGLAAPRGTSQPIVDRLNEEMRKALTHPEVERRFRELSGVPRPTTPVEFRAFVAEEIAKWKKVVEARKISID